MAPQHDLIRQKMTFKYSITAKNILKEFKRQLSVLSPVGSSYGATAAPADKQKGGGGAFAHLFAS